MKITPSQNRQVHQLLNQTKLVNVKEELVLSFTDGRSGSSRDLLFKEAEGLIRHLQKEQTKLVQPMRGKIIHYLCLLGFVDGKGQADFTRINEFIKGIGSNNPKKKILNYLYYDELCKVCTQVEAMYNHEVKRFKNE